MAAASSPAAPPTPYSESVAVVWWSFGINIALAVVKIGVGLGARSQALIADGLHSLSDLAADSTAIFGLKLAAKPVDADHPYGHHKFASLAGLAVAGLVLLFCAVLAWTSAHSLLGPAPAPPGWAALVVAALAMVMKESFYHYVTTQARRLKSRILAANALDHRADALASAMALAAIAAAHLGGNWAYLDKAVGLALAGYLFINGWKILHAASADLLDTAPNQEIINDLREHILTVPGVIAYHEFRARRVGDMYEVDLHLQVDPQLTVEQGHGIGHRVKDAIMARHPEVVDLLVHLEPASPPHLRDGGVSDRRPGAT